MLAVLLIIIAKIFEKFGKTFRGLHRMHLSGVSPGLAVVLRVNDGDFVVQGVLRSTCNPLDEMDIGSMLVAGRIQPASIVDSDGIDDQSIAFPVTDRISHERVGDIRMMRPAVRVDE